MGEALSQFVEEAQHLSSQFDSTTVFFHCGLERVPVRPVHAGCSRSGSCIGAYRGSQAHARTSR